jgi:catechol 2,3-dioxygenase-like lactoylglutathione lyase family enzyme
MAPTSQATYRPSHLGICVSDLETSMRFYCEGLGVTAAERYDLTSEALPGLAESLEVGQPVEVCSQMIRNDTMTIELLGYRSPSVAGAPSPSRGLLGLTHLSFWVDDLDAAVGRLVAHGGNLLPDTRHDLGVNLVFLADPDGVRVELMQASD